jgi:hypothetical protein
MVAMIREKPRVKFHGHLAEIIDAQGNVLRKQRPYSATAEAIEIGGQAALRGKLRQQVRFKETTCNFFHKSIWEAVGGHRHDYRFGHDLHFNIMAMACSDCALWNLYLVQLRRHSASDGARLPAALALENLQALIEKEILARLDEPTRWDRAAGRGWLQYRLIELVAQRLRTDPRQAFALLGARAGLLVDPLASIYCLRLLRNRLLYGDVQQSIPVQASARRSEAQRYGLEPGN